MIDGRTGTRRVSAITDLGTTLVLTEGAPLGSAAATGATFRGVARTVFADDVPVTSTGAFMIVGGAEGGTITRAAGDWNGFGFEVGQLVRIDGVPGSWRLMEITNAGTTLRLSRGSLLPSSTTTKTVFVAGPHGGLTVVHGGGNMPLETSFNMVRGTTSLTRQDGLAWTADGYATTFANGQPMHVQIAGEAFTRAIAGFGDIACPYADPFPGCGVGSVMLLGAPSIIGSGGLATPPGAR